MCLSSNYGEIYTLLFCPTATKNEKLSLARSMQQRLKTRHISHLNVHTVHTDVDFH